MTPKALAELKKAVGAMKASAKQLRAAFDLCDKDAGATRWALKNAIDSVEWQIIEMETLISAVEGAK